MHIEKLQKGKKETKKEKKETTVKSAFFGA
jgi:hypothetical protein